MCINCRLGVCLCEKLLIFFVCNACVLRLECLCGSAGLLVRLGSNTCCLWNTAFRDGKRRFRNLFGVLFLYFICKYFAIALCFCQLRIFAFETTANLSIGPEKRILKSLEKQSVKM